jgi:hypothetical protein
MGAANHDRAVGYWGANFVYSTTGRREGEERPTAATSLLVHMLNSQSEEAGVYLYLDESGCDLCGWARLFQPGLRNNNNSIQTSSSGEITPSSTTDGMHVMYLGAQNRWMIDIWATGLMCENFV